MELSKPIHLESYKGKTIRVRQWTKFGFAVPVYIGEYIDAKMEARAPGEFKTIADAVAATREEINKELRS